MRLFIDLLKLCVCLLSVINKKKKKITKLKVTIGKSYVLTLLIPIKEKIDILKCSVFLKGKVGPFFW